MSEKLESRSTLDSIRDPATLKQELLKMLIEEDVAGASALIGGSNFPCEVLQEEHIKEKIEKVLKSKIRKEEFDTALQFAHALELPQDTIRQVACDAVRSYYFYEPDKALKIKEAFNIDIPHEELEKMWGDSLCAYGWFYLNDNLDKILNLKRQLSISDEVFIVNVGRVISDIVTSSVSIKHIVSLAEKVNITQERLKEIVTPSIVKFLARSYHGLSNDTLKRLDELYFSESEKKNLSRKAFITCLNEGSLLYAEKLATVLNLEAAELQEEGILKTIRPLFVDLVLSQIEDKGSGQLYERRELIENTWLKFPTLLDDTQTKTKLIEGSGVLVVKDIDRACWDGSMLFVPSVLGITDAIFALPMVVKALEVYFYELLEHDNGSDNVLKIAEKFHQNQGNILLIITEILDEKLNRTFDVNIVHEWMERLKLPVKQFEKQAKTFLCRCLESGAEESAILTKEKFNLPDDVLKTAEVVNAAKKAIAKELQAQRIDVALLIESSFQPNFSVSDAQQYFPQMAEINDFFATNASSFKDARQPSTTLLFDLCVLSVSSSNLIEQLRKAPFLADAILENSRFGPRLIKAWPTFDEISKEKISLAYNMKKKILLKHEDLNPNSAEFRLLMQEELKRVGHNRQILSTMDTLGINSEEWLGYEQRSEFELRRDNERAGVYERLSVPINRVIQTLIKYDGLIKEIVAEHKTDLKSHKIIEENSRGKEELEKLNQRLRAAQSTGDERKTKGLEKAIEIAAAKSLQVNQTSALDTLQNGINVIAVLCNETAKQLSIIKEGEMQSQSPTASEGDYEDELISAKRSVRDYLYKLAKRVDQFRKEVDAILASALQGEAKTALIERIDTALKEEWITFDLDIADGIKLVTSKEGASGLEGHKAYISVWSRNPDVDLYQGNYSPCCISIESGAGGDKEESTIADYLTDLGVQLVSIYDTEKNIPIAVAWCWIGTSKVGTTSIVIDNIEANTDYSNEFPHLMGEKLIDYITSYGKAIGVERIELGTAHNDLPNGYMVSRMKSSGKKYLKTGGYNREGGYFLEAEDTKVVTVWKRDSEH